MLDKTHGLNGRVALITGASRGIGRCIAQHLATRGAHAVLNFRQDSSSASEARQEIEEAGGSAELQQWDVTDPHAAQTHITAILEQHGRLDILVNNAGVRHDAMFAWMESHEWQDVVNVSLNGFFNVTRHAVPAMLQNRWGRIINVSSISGVVGRAGQVNYAAAKAGLLGATRALAREVARKRITVNAVAPGFIDTEMLQGLATEDVVGEIPAGRIGTPDEVAALVAFLCSEQAAYITGEVIGVTGGFGG